MPNVSDARDSRKTESAGRFKRLTARPAHCHLGLARIARRAARAAAAEHDGIATAMFGTLGMRPWPTEAD
jgi:hypothetical protein